MIIERLILMGTPKNVMLNNDFDYDDIINFDPEILSVFPEKEYYNLENDQNDKIINILKNE